MNDDAKNVVENGEGGVVTHGREMAVPQSIAQHVPALVLYGLRSFCLLDQLTKRTTEWRLTNLTSNLMDQDLSLSQGKRGSLRSPGL